MAKAAKKASKRKLSLVADNEVYADRNTLRKVTLNEEAKLEYESNQVRFHTLRARTENQALYLQSMNASRITYGVGDAGTGKSFLATMWACKQLEEKEVERIVVSRPMVGCDEDMGFFPGTEMEKYVGWVGPVLEIIEGYFGKERAQTYIKYGKIQLKPLMLLRGSTFRNAVVILDEAQNTTPGQMKMFLTRTGESSKLIINGDPEQSDLPKGQINGLSQSIEILGSSKHVSTVHFTEDDIVRDPIVKEIIIAYKHYNNQHK